MWLVIFQRPFKLIYFSVIVEAKKNMHVLLKEIIVKQELHKLKLHQA